MMCLSTQPGNLMCLYHSQHTSSDYKNNLAPDIRRLHIKVTGVAFPRTATTRRTIESRANHIFSCSCWAKGVLIYFYNWKSIKAKSPSTKVNEGWQGDILKPCQRAVTVATIKRVAGLEVEDLYNVDDNDKVQKIPTLLRCQFCRLIDSYLNKDAAKHMKKSLNLLPKTPNESLNLPASSESMTH